MTPDFDILHLLKEVKYLINQVWIQIYTGKGINPRFWLRTHRWSWSVAGIRKDGSSWWKLMKLDCSTQLSCTYILHGHSTLDLHHDIIMEWMWESWWCNRGTATSTHFHLLSYSETLKGFRSSCWWQRSKGGMDGNVLFSIYSLFFLIFSLFVWFLLLVLRCLLQFTLWQCTCVQETHAAVSPCMCCTFLHHCSK